MGRLDAQMETLSESLSSLYIYNSRIVLPEDLKMRFLYSRLPVHKPNTERDEEDEDGSEQSLEPPRAFCKWLPMFLIILLLTNAITLLGSLYWASLRELRMKEEPPLAYGNCKTSYFCAIVWLTPVVHKQHRYLSRSIQHGDDSDGTRPTTTPTGDRRTLTRSGKISALHMDILLWIATWLSRGDGRIVWVCRRTRKRGYISWRHITIYIAWYGTWLMDIFCGDLPIQRFIREIFWEAVEKKPHMYSPEPHIDYCFDTLRQVCLFLRPYCGYNANYNSTFNATQIAPPSTNSEISPQEMTSCTGAKTGLSFEIMQRDIRHVFEMDRRMYQCLRDLVFAIWARMVLSIWLSDPRNLVNCSRNVDDTTQFEIQRPLCTFDQSKLSILGSMGSTERLSRPSEYLLQETSETGIEFQFFCSPFGSLAPQSRKSMDANTAASTGKGSRNFPKYSDQFSYHWNL